MADFVQIGIKCVKCLSGHAFGYDPDTEPAFTCIKCGYKFRTKELHEQIKPQLLVIAEKEARKAFKDLLSRP
jgi:hypothetical protein